MSENRFWLSLWLGLALLVTILVSVVCVTDTMDKKRYIEAGYTQKQVNSNIQTTYRWVKD